MGQYIEKSNIIVRWLLIAANLITLVNIPTIETEI